MFLHTLTEDQKRAFTALAAAVIQADQRRADEEASLMTRLAAELGQPRGDLPSMQEALSAFDAAAARRAAMIELMGIAFCDGEMADLEATLIDDVADRWSIGLEERSALFDWVIRQAALLSEADKLIGA